MNMRKFIASVFMFVIVAGIAFGGGYIGYRIGLEEGEANQEKENTVEQEQLEVLKSIKEGILNFIGEQRDSKEDNISDENEDSESTNSSEEEEEDNSVEDFRPLTDEDLRNDLLERFFNF